MKSDKKLTYLEIEMFQNECEIENLQIENNILQDKIDLLAKDIEMDIKKIRKSLGLNQKEFGKLFFKSQQSVSDWENGTAKPPKRILEAIMEIGKDENNS